MGEKTYPSKELIRKKKKKLLRSGLSDITFVWVFLFVCFGPIPHKFRFHLIDEPKLPGPKISRSCWGGWHMKFRVTNSYHVGILYSARWKETENPAPDVQSFSVWNAYMLPSFKVVKFLAKESYTSNILFQLICKIQPFLRLWFLKFHYQLLS